ncbi:bacteriocin [Sinorhizobium sp. NFACC03]|uniref:bacteriocin n=1 Tax=Sinorhizobium sp. NFACC03 TaxID=1566295 RepID=UPI00088C9EF7|nr:bacteriocin [Sinorhizobium sp. NFACC03]SDA93684.1 bacteriocin-type signal sequence-containing protein [Sinorhizobium sp. NFACC03]
MDYDSITAEASGLRELNEKELDAVSGGLYFEMGEFRFATGSYGAIATWGGGHVNGGLTVGYSSSTHEFYINQ